MKHGGKRTMAALLFALLLSGLLCGCEERVQGPPPVEVRVALEIIVDRWAPEHWDTWENWDRLASIGPTMVIEQGVWETSDSELAGEIWALYESLKFNNCNKPMDDPRYYVTFQWENGATESWRINGDGVVCGDRFEGGNHCLTGREQSPSPYDRLTDWLDQMDAVEP